MASSTKSSKSPAKAPAKPTSSSEKTPAKKPAIDTADLIGDEAGSEATGSDVTTEEPTEAEPATPVPASLVDRLTHPTTSTSETAPASQDVGQPAAEPSSGQFDLPICLDTEETTDNPSSIRIVVEAYGKNCLKCVHLIPSAQTEFTDCHFSKGNKSCPAQSVKVVFVGLRNHYITHLNSARDAGDSNKVLRILAKLENEPLDLKNYVLRRVGLLA